MKILTKALLSTAILAMTATAASADVTIYYDNSASGWSGVNIHYWDTPHTSWPGTSMTQVNDNIWSYTFEGDPSTLRGFLFCNTSGSDQTGDYTGVPVDDHLYKGTGGKGAVTDEGPYNGGVTLTKAIVTATPGSGSRFTDNITVTLSVNPAATIHYTTDGSTPSASSSVYSAPLTFTETTTLRTLAVAGDGGENLQSFIYTKGAPVIPGESRNLVTDYYKVNHDGHFGTRRTVNMSFSNQKSTTALSNWSDADMIAQGVARDVCMAIKGTHERPVVDSYAIYASYDNDNLYLGVQMVYTVWDAYGEGKQPGESKPYNMDGRLMWAFDLDPDKQFDGYIDGKHAIWNGGSELDGAYFDNGVDAVWCGSTKPGVGIPGFFISTPDGHASYDAAYCKNIPGTYYGYADGILPSITGIWGQEKFEYDPAVLEANDGFADLTAEIPASAHTFYEFRFPLSVLGVSADYIENYGIGVQYIDVYGSSPIGGTPYDPSFFDNAKASYSKEKSTSAEKEDKDVITYSPARVGYRGSSSGIGNVAAVAPSFSVIPSAGSITVNGAEGLNIVVAGIDGKVYHSGIAPASVQLTLPSGIYIVSAGGKAVKTIVK